MTAERPRPGHPAGRLRVALIGEHGLGNLGNDASVRVMIEMVRRIEPHADIRVYGYVPDRMSEAFGIPSFSINNAGVRAELLPKVARLVAKALGKIGDPIRTLLQLRGVDVVMVPGTGVFEGELGIRPFGLPFTLLRMSAAGRLHRARVAYVAVGASPIGNRIGRVFMRMAAGLADYRSYRDELSKAALEGFGVRASLDPVYSDLVFALPTPRLVKSDGIGRSPTVAVGVMYYQGTDEARAELKDTYAAYVDKIVAFVDWLARRGCHVRLTIGERVDWRVVDEILARLPTHREDGIITAAKIERFEDLLATFAEVDFVVASRYHNILAAVMMARPVISISYARKADALLREAGQPLATQNISDLDVELLKRQFDDMTGHAMQISQELDAYCMLARGRATQQEAELREYVLVRRRVKREPRRG